jgi:hypothetical protein
VLFVAHGDSRKAHRKPFKRLMVLICQNYTPQGIVVDILIWDLGIGVLGSSTFDGVEF